RDIVEGHGGYVFSTAGDSFAVAFSDPTRALAAAVQAQSLISIQDWPPPVSIKVRMGIHSGIAAERDGDYFGSAPNRCARVMAVASGGQILLTAATHGMVQDHLLDGVGFTDLGQHQLRDLTAPERIFAVVHPALSPVTAIRSLTTLPNNLPAQLTSFVGREEELAQATKLLGESRLLTVAGVGGSGKTRLALQVAAEASTRFRDGVWLVELAPVAEPEGVVRAVNAVLAVQEMPESSLEEVLIEHLRPRNALLILDNCEHLVATVAALVERLLGAAPQLTVMVTSRELLGVPGEIAYQLRSMRVPDEEPPLEELTAYDAIQLFVSRGEAAQAGFRLTSANAATVIQLCRRLDGMPLALELAAARLRVLSLEQIAARLDDRFRLLTGGSRTALPRQQTLQAAIDWSYDLLSEGEKLLFDRLSVFQGGFTLEAAEEVCAGDGIDQFEVLDLVSHLVDKSLVAVGDSAEGARYRMLETLRQYARERLVERGETEPIRRRHALHFHDLTNRALPHLRGPEEDRWLDRLETEHDNLRQALRWAIDAGQVDLGQSLAGLLYRFWMLTNHVLEGRAWLEQVLALGTGSPSARGRALLGAGTLSMVHFDMATARRDLEEALTAIRQAGDDVLLSAALNNLAIILIETGETEASIKVLEEELELGLTRGDHETAAFTYQNLADLALSDGDLARAHGLLADSLTHARGFGSRILLSNALARAGLALLAVDDLAGAEAHLEELAALGRIPSAPGRHFVIPGLLKGRQGNYQAAFADLQHLALFRTVAGYQQLSGVMREAFLQWAKIELDRDLPERAAIILAAAEKLRSRRRFGHEQRFADRTLAEIKGALSPEALAAAWETGSSMNIDDLIDFCLEAIPQGQK
ncbi:MAG TPA: tetratricopeptide repeat protein, partial [Acidimicrobiia bacterium]|nr:tetratricopeptide repeat protein [Acidimicrobiia bacterium]